MLKVESHGQVFTTPEVVTQMLALRQNTGRVLEPSCGDGAFSAQLGAECVAIELDPAHAPVGALQMDFFDYPVSEQFATIIGNPPYVRYQDILSDTRGKLDHTLFDRRSNLYLFFIAKCVQHLLPGGELIFIVPRELAKATAARHLNELLFKTGTITHYLEMGDARIFKGAVPNTVIFRFQKDLFERRMADGRWFNVANGQLLFTREPGGVALGEYFNVRVGAVSGADEVFGHPAGNEAFVTSRTFDTGETRPMLYNIEHPALVPHKARLLSRGIRTFDEDNWWQWGRAFYQSDAERLYVNAKTRRPQPFFEHPAKAYDGSILALFPRRPWRSAGAAAAALNLLDWNELGFVCDGRLLFSQRSLETCLLPAEQEATLATAFLPSGATL